MKPTAINQEMLLFTNTSFASRDYCSNKKESNSDIENSISEKLEKACWDGLLPEMLPELHSPHLSFIWQITHGSHFLKINMGLYPFVINNTTTLDPYSLDKNFFKN